MRQVILLVSMCIILGILIGLVSAAEPTPYAFWQFPPTPTSGSYLAQDTSITVSVTNDRRYSTPDFIFVSLVGPTGNTSTNRDMSFTSIPEATPVSYTFTNLSNGTYLLWGYAVANNLTRPIVNVFHFGGTPLEQNISNITLGPIIITTPINTTNYTNATAPGTPQNFTPQITISSYATTPTHHNITVTATVERGILDYYNHTFESNGAFTFTATNNSNATLGTVTVTRTVTINNIDKTPPTATVSYSTTAITNGSVLATITPSENVTGTISYNFTTNGSYTFIFYDLADNQGNVTAYVNNIRVTTPMIVTTTTTNTSNITGPLTTGPLYTANASSAEPFVPPPKGPGPTERFFNNIQDWYSKNKKAVIWSSFGLILATAIFFLLFLFIKDRKKKETQMIYVMENLVETDCNNGNGKTYSNYIHEHLMPITFLTTPNKETIHINRIGQVPIIKEGKDIYDGGRAYNFPILFLWRNRHKFSHIWCYASRASTFWITLFKKVYGRTMIIKCDSVIPDQQAKGLRKLWQYLTIKWPFKNADIIIVESNRILEAIQPYAKKSFATGNVIVMPNCVHVKDIDMTKFQKAINSKLREKTIISIGRIEPIKGTLDLIRAFDIFRKYHPDWKLKIIGPLTNKEYVIEALKLKTKLGIPDSSLKFTGPKFGDDLYLEMAKAHTFTIASHPLGDGRNNTLPYTLYFGCQPVVTDVGDMKEAVNPIGITCIKPQDPLAMAMAMEKAIIKPVPLATMQDYILDNLNWETHLPKLLKAIRLTVDENNKDEQGQNEIK